MLSNVEQLRQLELRLKEEKRLREEAEARSQEAEDRSREEKRRREEAEARSREEKRRREEAEKKGREENSRRTEERRLRREAEAQNRENRRLLDEAERKIRPTTLPEFLNACHLHLSLNMEIETNPELVTKGGTTTVTGKIHPINIRQWAEFPNEQERVWKRLYDADLDAFNTARVFHSLNFIETFGTSASNPKIGSEKDLESYERYKVENHVSFIIDRLKASSEIREEFGIAENVKFENHANTLNQDTEKLAQEITENVVQRAENMSAEAKELVAREDENQVDEVAEQAERLAGIAISTPRRRTGRKPKNASKKLQNADQICVYSIKKDHRIPIFVVEYKPPHKLEPQDNS